MLNMKIFSILVLLIYRGALNKILSLSPQERKKGVIAMSAGNHARGVSLACKLLNTKAIIVMPNNTPFEKIRRNLELGAKVEIYGDNVLESEKYVNQLIKKHGYNKIILLMILMLFMGKELL